MLWMICVYGVMGNVVNGLCVWCNGKWGMLWMVCVYGVMGNVVNGLCVCCNGVSYYVSITVYIVHKCSIKIFVKLNLKLCVFGPYQINSNLSLHNKSLALSLSLVKIA